MEKLDFGALLKTAFKRCLERQLSHLVAIEVLVIFIAALPFAIGGIVLVLLSVMEDPGNAPAILGIFGGMALYYLLFIYFVCLVGYGMTREILYPEAQICRGLKSGFARWKVAFYPVPWFFAAIFITLAWGLVQAVLLRFVPSASSLTKLVEFAISVVLGAVSTFLLFAVSASDTGVGFGDLYHRAFTALKNGWGRYLGGLAMTYLLILTLMVPTVIMVMLFFHPKMRVVPFEIGIPVFAVWLCVLIWAALRLLIFFNVYFLNLFVDASGISRAEMGLPGGDAPETATPATAEIPAAPQTPEAQVTEQDK